MFTVRNLDTLSISKLLWKALPDLGAVNGSFVLSGSLTQLAVSKARLETKTSTGLKISASGAVAKIDVLGKEKYQG